MACDRFVKFKQRAPSQAEIRVLLEDFLGESGWVEEDGRLYATLPGKPSFPFKRQPGMNDREQQNERWFEVFCGDDNVDVITRQADEFTNVVAEGFAKMLARWYEASLDQ